MANHKSAKKRIKTNEKRRLLNRYQYKTARTVVKKLVEANSTEEATPLLKDAASRLDKLAKKNIIHWKKAANQKSKLARRVNALATS